MRLNVLLERKGTIICKSNDDIPVRTVVWARIVPDRVMSYDLLLGQDSGDNVRVRKHRDNTHESETIVTFTAQDEETVAGNHGFRKWVNQAIGMIERPADCKVVVRYADKSCVLSEGCICVKVELRNGDESAAYPGLYYVRFKDEWTPNEAIVAAILSEIPLHWAESSEHHLRSQTTLEYARPRLRQVNLVNAEVIPQDLTSPQQATLTKYKKTSDTTCMAEKPEQEKCPAQPPHNVIIQLDP